MPTQSEFEGAAGEFDRSATHVDELFRGPRQLLDEGVLVGGMLTLELNLLFEHLRAMLSRRADELRDLAATCRSRAEACAAHQAALRAFGTATDAYEGELRRWAMQSEAHDRWPSLVAPPGPVPRPPTAPSTPPSWVSAGR